MRFAHFVRSTRTSAVVAILALAAMTAFLTGRARAAEKLPVGGSASVVSLDQIAKLAKTLGIELPPFLTAKGIEAQFAFLGPDGLDAGKPIGIVLFAKQGWDLQKGEGMVFVLPAKPGAAPLKAFIDAGGKPIEGHDDSVSLNGIGFRRTADALIFSPTADAALAIDPAELANQYKAAAGGGGESAIARVVVNVDAMRSAQPQQFDAFMENIRQSSPATDEAGRLGQGLVVNFLKTLNRLDLTLARDGRDLQLKLGVAPAEVPAAGHFSRPGMPAASLLRVDVDASPLKLVPSLDNVLAQFAKAVPMENGKPGNPEDQAQLASFLREAADTFLGGQAVSLGLEARGDDAIVYLVEQQAPPDLDSLLKALADHFNALSQKLDKSGDSSVKVEHYAGANGLAVTRLALMEKGKTAGCIDVAGKDGSAFIAGSADSEHHLDALANLPPGDPMSTLFYGVVSLQRAFEAAQKSPDSGLSKMPPERVKVIADLVRNRVLTFSADGQGGAIVFSVALPEDLLKQFVEMVQPNQGAAQKPADPNGGL